MGFVSKLHKTVFYRKDFHGPWPSKNLRKRVEQALTEDGASRFDLVPPRHESGKSSYSRREASMRKKGHYNLKCFERAGSTS
jgi:hypothetical protein